MIWKTVKKSELLGRRAAYEDEVLTHLKDSLPEGVRATIVADRGFGGQERYQQLSEQGLDYVIRFRDCILLTDEQGHQARASEWLTSTGRSKMHKNMGVTNSCYVVPAVVLAHDKKMDAPWCLATSRSDLSAPEVVKWYGKRFTIEKTFRDAKSGLLGMGLSATHIKNKARRDRLILIAALAHMLLTLLGAAGELCGLDRTLKSNTSAKRQLSLFNQGLHWYMAIPRMREERLVMLVDAYAEVLRQHEMTRQLFGIL